MNEADEMAKVGDRRAGSEMGDVSLTEAAYREIEERIVTLVLRPGEVQY